MSHNVNLGQASFRTEDSPLQLQFKAIGHFKLPINNSMQLSEGENIQLPQLISAWVSEAPELELRLHVNIALCLEWSLSRFISSLGERMCDSMVSNSHSIVTAVPFDDIDLRFGRGLDSRSFSRAAKLPRIAMVPERAVSYLDFTKGNAQLANSPIEKCH